MRHNQTALQASYYTLLCAQLHTSRILESNMIAARSKRTFTLPENYIEWGRYMRQNTHDIIAMSNKVGYPKIFQTKTCNPQWPEISNAFFLGQSVTDCPSLSARFFWIKLGALMAFVIYEKRIWRHVRGTWEVSRFESKTFHKCIATFSWLNSPKQNFFSHQLLTPLYQRRCLLPQISPFVG